MVITFAHRPYMAKPRTGTEQLCKRYLQDRVPISQCAVVRARSASKPCRLALSFYRGNLQSFVFLNAATEKPSQHHETASQKNQNAVSLGQVSPTAWPFLWLALRHRGRGAPHQEAALDLAPILAPNSKIGDLTSLRPTGDPKKSRKYGPSDMQRYRCNAAEQLD